MKTMKMNGRGLPSRFNPANDLMDASALTILPDTSRAHYLYPFVLNRDEAGHLLVIVNIDFKICNLQLTSTGFRLGR